jgi:nitrite reductase (NADH) small subunit
MNPENWVEVCRLEELPPGGRKLARIDNLEIALFNLNGTFYAIKNRCPHRGGPLIRGFLDSGGGIKCPMHGWRFNLRDGSSQRPVQATVYRMKVENGHLYLCV